MLAMLPALFSTIGSGIKTWLENRKEIKQAEQKLKLAVIENKTRLALETQSHNSAWEMRQLDLSDRMLRRATFLAIMAPFVVGIFYPAQVNTYMITVINIVPVWWRELAATIILAVWGIKAIGDKVPLVIEALRATKNQARENLSQLEDPFETKK